MLDNLLVSLPLLELQDILHAAFGVLDDGSGDRDMRGVDDGATAQSVFSRANLEDAVECKRVANAHVFQSRNG